MPPLADNTTTTAKRQKAKQEIHVDSTAHRKSLENSPDLRKWVLPRVDSNHQPFG